MFPQPVSAGRTHICFHTCEVRRGADSESCSDRLVIMTNIICCTFIFCSKWWTNVQTVPRDCVIKMSVWRRASALWQACGLFLSRNQWGKEINYDCTRRQKKSSCMIQLDNVGRHGDQLSFVRQLVLMKHKITAASAPDFLWCPLLLTEQLNALNTVLFGTIVHIEMFSCIVLVLRNIDAVKRFKKQGRSLVI